MSLHGRIYVEKSITLELQRKRQRDQHLKSLSIIQGSTDRLNMRQVTRSTDLQMRQLHLQKQVNNEFRDLQHKRELGKENKKLFMKLVDISKGKHLAVHDFRTIKVESGLGNYKSHGRNASTSKLGYSSSRNHMRSAKHGNSKNFRDQNYSLDLNIDGQFRTRYHSPPRLLHEIQRKEQKRLIEIDNFKLAQKLITVKGNQRLNRTSLQADFMKHNKAKANLCKLPIIDMSKNKFNRNLHLFSPGSRNPKHTYGYIRRSEQTSLKKMYSSRRILHSNNSSQRHVGRMQSSQAKKIKKASQMVQSYDPTLSGLLSPRTNGSQPETNNFNHQFHKNTKTIIPINNSEEVVINLKTEEEPDRNNSAKIIPEDESIQSGGEVNIGERATMPAKKKRKHKKQNSIIKQAEFAMKNNVKSTELMNSISQQQVSSTGNPHYSYQPTQHNSIVAGINPNSPSNIGLKSQIRKGQRNRTLTNIKIIESTTNLKNDEINIKPKKKKSRRKHQKQQQQLMQQRQEEGNPTNRPGFQLRNDMVEKMKQLESSEVSKDIDEEEPQQAEEE